MDFKQFDNQAWVNEFMLLSVVNFTLACVGVWPTGGGRNKFVH